ncbi:thrombospondin-2-like [Saccostrea echinata]|uniref:thrombospondin-2-like n=1 Tax=Saccostrea echinata TaxID=191078 RepID=UPI002A7F8DEC|nr:thrombospondin-2-like [Saccostrea echinata]
MTLLRNMKITNSYQAQKTLVQYKSGAEQTQSSRKTSESDGREKICGEVSCNNYSTCKLTTFNKRVCIETDCAEPLPNLVNGEVITQTNNPISATFGCNTGFTGVGSKNTIHCSPGGRWTLLSYRCEPPVQGGWSSWGEWGTCSRTCGSGTKDRSRSCNNPSPMYGGNYCIGNSINTILCNTNNCPIHGGWSSWNEWGTCSKTCESGMKDRSRDCNNPSPMYGGDYCNGSSIDITLCNTNDCPSMSISMEAGVLGEAGHYAPKPVILGASPEAEAVTTLTLEMEEQAAAVCQSSLQSVTQMNAQDGGVEGENEMLSMTSCNLSLIRSFSFYNRIYRTCSSNVAKLKKDQ